MSEENKKRLREYKKNCREAKKHALQIQICQYKYVTKLLLQRSFLFVLVLIFIR